MYIIVTGAAGFIGSNLVRALNARGETNIIAVDNLAHADKFHNLADAEIADYLDQDELVHRLSAGDFEAAVRPVRAPDAPRAHGADRGLALLQRLRPTRAAQGTDGLGGLSLLRAVSRRGQ